MNEWIRSFGGVKLGEERRIIRRKMCTLTTQATSKIHILGLGLKSGPNHE